ncbi:hypothetical protein QNH23_06280 [Siminovitchia fortis]|uniref:Uncharacterized protein n=1 Tax=Siminovitchia fortis TaxID=254758 RepID=A0A443IM28_9BACI|nr:hypothetical protein [Siminovitchia fortis]RWR06714.1 hypothetical protein D4N35_013690 [Siminovitchia fortis]WHY82978.1 hypothetical protein QNH23_06280 [Siminovitchia fortis]
MYFYTKNGTVFQPENQILQGFYDLLKHYAPYYEGSPFFNDLIDLYETLDFDLKGDNNDESI